MPVIRIKIARMKYSIASTISLHNEEIEQIVNEQVERAIAEYPFAEEIKRLSDMFITEVITKAVHEFYNDSGGRDIVRDAVMKSLRGR